MRHPKIRNTRRTMAFLAACFAAAALAAEDAPAPPAGPPPVWSGKGEASYVATSGNTSVQTIGAGLEVDYKKDLWSGLAKGVFVRAESEGVETARSLAGEARAARSLSPRFELFVQADYLKNTFAGIDNRYAGVAGAAYSVVKTPTQELKAQAGLGYTKEDRLAGGNRSFASAVAGLLYKLKLSKTSDLSEELLYTRDLRDSQDWRVANTFSVSAAISTVFSLKASHVLNYLREPVPGFGRTDTITSLALVAKF